MNQTETTTELLTAYQMAKLCGIADSTLTLYYYKGIVPGDTSRSRKPRFDPERVAAALDQYHRDHPPQHWKSKARVVAV